MLLHPLQYFLRIDYVRVGFDVIVGTIDCLVSLYEVIAFNFDDLSEDFVGVQNL